MLTGKVSQVGLAASYRTNSRKEMLEFVPMSAVRILELGCGEGNFSSLIKKRQNAETWGIEIDKVSASAAAEHLDRVVVGDITAAIKSIPKCYFDCIVANDVLEHMQWPGLVLQEVLHYLAPDGLVVASIPNVRYFRSLIEIVIQGDFQYRNEGIFDETHLRFFTAKSIHRLFSENGYEVVNIEGINPEGGRFSRLISLLNLVSLKRLADTRYMQFAVIAKPSSRMPPSNGR
jgi:2-polyprenyl-3-methyl-5-hydroxy-6-metoxy-1,4-benzoquinol methylase